ncbi:MAG: 5-(carboxyamino)imidazole ribonucleotide synthase [Sphingobacteriales bacterium]|jgi:5-(carboxyamino)imidazole ribonucleotide synthase
MKFLTPFSENQRVGILGGGQLGRMLLPEFNKLNIEVHILDPDKNCPCSRLTPHFEVGDLNNFDQVLAFGQKVDIVTVEIENVNVDALRALKEQGIKVFPDPEILRTVKDKGIQKQFFKDHGIPTADFTLHQGKYSNQSLPFVQKMCTGGYDGKGVQVIKTQEGLAEFWKEASVIEELIPFEKEIAVIVARNERAEIKTYPPVEMEFHPTANLVEFLFWPTSMSAKLEAEAENLAEKVAKAFNLVGILAVEMFLTKEGKLLVNEVAPRPHNSGHHTIEASVTSQYLQHVRTLLDLPLGDTSIVIPSVMINILGEEGATGEVAYKNLDEVLKQSGTYVHLYGKRTTKPFRKLGHVTVCNKDLEKAKETARFVMKTLKATSI